MFNEKSEHRLNGVNPQLRAVMQRTEADYIYKYPDREVQITEGIRSFKRQRYLYETGKTQLAIGPHCYGEAVDIHIIINGKISWEEQPYIDFHIMFKNIASLHALEYRWGGNWPKFKDYVHFEMQTILTKVST
jgi:D-alanyl-D-alanine carboxypeptidase